MAEGSENPPVEDEDDPAGPPAPTGPDAPVPSLPVSPLPADAFGLAAWDTAEMFKSAPALPLPFAADPGVARFDCEPELPDPLQLAPD